MQMNRSAPRQARLPFRPLDIAGGRGEAHGDCPVPQDAPLEDGGWDEHGATIVHADGTAEGTDALPRTRRGPAEGGAPRRRVANHWKDCVMLDTTMLNPTCHCGKQMSYKGHRSLGTDHIIFHWGCEDCDRHRRECITSATPCPPTCKGWQGGCYERDVDCPLGP